MYGNLTILSLLVNIKGIYINAKDTESGYTSLHRCLLNGDLRMALVLLSNPSVDFDLKDHENMTFLDLLNASIKLPKPQPLLDQVSKDVAISTDRSAMSLWSWGSNSNYVRTFN